MKLTRRDLLKFSALSGAAILSSGLQGCGGDSSKKSDDEGNQITYQFNHGIASGDPLAESVIIWTRVTPSAATDVTVQWQVATDRAFTQLVNQDQAVVTAERDYTVKVDVQGLNAGTNYYYRFMVGEGDQRVVSDLGQTKTLPAGNVSQVTMAVFSCSNYPAGFFNVYKEAALRNDLDVMVHLGDYLYEYAREENGAPAYASEDAHALNREVLPANELLSLTDYRERYAQYHTDADLQAAHAAAPFIVVWDDHEIANDAYKTGAENHDSATEGDFENRKMAAIQAYFEWLPLRPITPDASGKIYRQFEFGNLVNLIMLDTRIIGRDKQLDYADFIDGTTGELNASGFTQAVSSSERSLLGATQRAWLTDTMNQSTATWQVLGQQVLMTRMLLPAVTLTPSPENPTVSLTEYAAIATAAYTYQALLGLGVADTDADLNAAGMSDAQIAIVRDATQMAYLDSPKIPYNLDAWDGYAYDREVLLAAAFAGNKNLISLAGDTHNAWLGALTDQNGVRVGTEFATSSVSSPGIEEYLGIPDAASAREMEAGLPTLVTDLEYANLRERGYLVVTFTPTQASAEWLFVDTVKSKTYQIQTALTKHASVSAQ